VGIGGHYKWDSDDTYVIDIVSREYHERQTNYRWLLYDKLWQ
jgi:hypothetical protein